VGSLETQILLAARPQVITQAMASTRPGIVLKAQGRNQVLQSSPRATLIQASVPGATPTPSSYFYPTPS
jgi:hypothetical protein